MSAPTTSLALEAPINALAWSPDSTTCAAAMGDGAVALWRIGLPAPVPVELDGTPLSLISTPTGFFAGTDAGTLWHISPQGEATLRSTFPGTFLEHLAYIPKSRTVAVAVGKKLALVPPTGEATFCALPCPSTIAGLAVSPLGPRVATSHYGGVRIFDASSPATPPRVLEWKGSHLGLTYSPNGRWLISAMQERALHLWRLSDGLDLQMRGYPGPIEQLQWDSSGTRLGTTGGNGVPLWDFTPGKGGDDRGPAGQQALVLANSGNDDILVTALALHPKGPFAAVGYTDGLVLLTNIPEDRAVLLHAPAESPQAQSPTTHLAFNPTGLHLAMAHANGTLSMLDFAQLA